MDFAAALKNCNECFETSRPSTHLIHYPITDFGEKPLNQRSILTDCAESDSSCRHANCNALCSRLGTNQVGTLRIARVKTNSHSLRRCRIEPIRVGVLKNLRFPRLKRSSADGCRDPLRGAPGLEIPEGLHPVRAGQEASRLRWQR